MGKPRTKQSDGTRQKRQAAAEERVDDFRGYVGLRSLLNPIWCFHGFRVSVIILTIFGVIMVFSSSSVNMIANGQSPWSQAIKQGGFCVLGLIVGVACMMVPAKLIRKVSFAFLFVALCLQSLTFTPLGIDVQGNKGWIGVFGFTFQLGIDATKSIRTTDKLRRNPKDKKGQACAMRMAASGAD